MTRLRWPAALVCLVLAACSTAPKAPIVAPVAEAKPIRIDPRVLRECDPPPSLQDTSDKAVLVFVKDLLGRYADCAQSKRALNAEVRRLIAPPPAASAPAPD